MYSKTLHFSVIYGAGRLVWSVPALHHISGLLLYTEQELRGGGKKYVVCIYVCSPAATGCCQRPFQRVGCGHDAHGICDALCSRVVFAVIYAVYGTSKAGADRFPCREEEETILLRKAILSQNTLISRGRTADQPLQQQVCYGSVGYYCCCCSTICRIATFVHRHRNLSLPYSYVQRRKAARFSQRDVPSARVSSLDNVRRERANHK